MINEYIPDPDVLELSLQYQKDLPPEFFTDLVIVTSDLASVRRPSVFRPRGPDRSTATEATKGWSTTVREAILHELHLLICTNEPKYQDVRSQGQSLSKPGVSAVAGALVTVFAGVPAGLITGAVSFLLLAVTKVGINVFCRVYSPPQLPE